MKTRTAWIAWLLPLLLLGGCRKASAEREVRVVVSGPGRLARAEGFALQLRSYGLPGVRVRVCDAGGDTRQLVTCTRGPAALLVTVGGIETRTAMEAGGSTPLLFVGLAATREWGYVASLKHPGGRASGVDNNYAELSGKRLELLRLALPGLRRAVVLYQPGVVPTPRGLASLERAAAALGVELAYAPVREPEDLADLEGVLAGSGAQAALLLPSFVLENALDRVVAATRAAGMPLVGLDRAQVRAGALLAYGASGEAMGRQAARMARQLLQGYPVALMPVERPLEMRLSVNLTAARELGIELDPRFLSLAQEVVR